MSAASGCPGQRYLRTNAAKPFAKAAPYVYAAKDADGNAGEVTLKFTKDDLDEKIAAQCWQMKVGELSGVIETPYAWHIVKVLKRNPATDDDEETIEFAQIKLEKEFLEPEFSEGEARDKAKTLILRSAMRAKFAELLKRTHIDSKIPLSDGDKGRGPRVKIERNR